MAGDGSQTRSLCYVDDLGRRARADAPLRQRRAQINIGNPREMTVLALARIVLELTGSQSPIAFIPRPVVDPTVGGRTSPRPVLP